VRSGAPDDCIGTSCPGTNSPNSSMAFSTARASDLNVERSFCGCTPRALRRYRRVLEPCALSRVSAARHLCPQWMHQWQTRNDSVGSGSENDWRGTCAMMSVRASNAFRVPFSLRSISSRSPIENSGHACWCQSVCPMPYLLPCADDRGDCN